LGGIGGGRGDPSATNIFAVIDDEFGGIGGGRGDPSARNVSTFIDDFGGIGGGKGEPSANCVRSIVMGLPAVRLTDRTTSSIINIARAETAKASAVFFKGVALLEHIIRRDS
jgi:hypothetical protein